MKKKRWLSLLVFLTVLVSLGTVFAESKPSAKVHFIDVGQADAILIQADGHTILIDAGNADDAKKIIAYLDKNNISQLDAIIGTHPHEDHIGGAAAVLKSVGADKIYLPKVAANTKTFENLLLTIRDLGMKVTVPKVGDYLINDKDVKLQVLAPASSDYSETNEYSIVTKLTVGSKTFLLTGDAEAKSEKEMIGGKISLKADVLKVGHHGGKTSTSSSFLKKVVPAYAVISVGAGNTYKHPHKETLDRIAKIKTLRTDLNGTIVFTTDGTTLSVQSEKSAKAAVKPVVVPATSSQVSIFITKTGEKYHVEGCSGLSRSKIPITLKEAKAQGYGPCGLCHPPK